jgi:uncharacterized protein (DUF433 family)
MESYLDRVEKNPDVMLGKPVIKGTRIPVELIIRKLGEGASTEDLLDAYPNLVAFGGPFKGWHRSPQSFVLRPDA